MSRHDFQGVSYALAKWMQEAADEIARGERAGATILYDRPASEFEKLKLKVRRRANKVVRVW